MRPLFGVVTEEEEDERAGFWGVVVLAGFVDGGTFFMFYVILCSR